MSWVRPLRITTPEGDTIHGGCWPDGRIFLWDVNTAYAEAFALEEPFHDEMNTRGWTVEWEASA